MQTARLKTMVATLGLLIATLGIGSAASAAVIQIDLNNVGTNPGTGWNVLEAGDIGGSAVALVDENGDPLPGTTVTLDSGWQVSGSSGNSGAYGIAAADDYFFVRSSTGTQTAEMTLQGLETGTYQVELYASISTDSTSRLGDYQANGVFGDGSSPENGDDFDGHVDGFDNGTVMTWSTISVGQDGLMSILVDTTLPDATRVSVLNAVRVMLIPEPSSMALLGLGTLLIVSRRRTR